MSQTQPVRKGPGHFNNHSPFHKLISLQVRHPQTTPALGFHDYMSQIAHIWVCPFLISQLNSSALFNYRRRIKRLCSFVSNVGTNFYWGPDDHGWAQSCLAFKLVQCWWTISWNYFRAHKLVFFFFPLVWKQSIKHHEQFSQFKIVFPEVLGVVL